VRSACLGEDDSKSNLRRMQNNDEKGGRGMMNLSDDEKAGIFRQMIFDYIKDVRTKFQDEDEDVDMIVHQAVAQAYKSFGTFVLIDLGVEGFMALTGRIISEVSKEGDIR
jgi:hypothetical protein